MSVEPIITYPGEPHPDGEHQWKSWWIAIFFDPQKPLSGADLDWVHRCWTETKARVCIGRR